MGAIAVAIEVPNSICIVEATLSFAMKPAIRDVTMRQSPMSSGRKIGAIALATSAIRLVEESVTKFR